MDPITVIVIAALFAACSSPHNNGADTTLPIDDVQDTSYAGVDYIPPTDRVSTTPDGDIAQDTDTYVAPAVVTNDHGPLSPTFPLQGKITLFAHSPCGKGSFINDIDDSGLGTCSGNPDNKVFQLDNTGVSSSQKLAMTLDQIDQGPNGDIAITGFPSPANAGLLRLYGIKAVPSTLTFGAINVDNETFVPKFPKGVQFAAGKLFIAAGDIQFDANFNATSYSPGAALVYEAGAVTPQAISTHGHNPTSIGSWSQDGIPYVAIVNTEYLNGNGETQGQKSSLAVFNAETLEAKAPITLPFGGFGVAGEIAVAGGFMAIPSADNSGRIAVLSTNDLTSAPQILTLTDAQGKSGPYLVSFAKIYGHTLLAGSFNTGTISTWDLNATPPKLMDSTIQFDAMSLGDAACVGGDAKTPCKLLVTSGDKIMAVE